VRRSRCHDVEDLRAATDDEVILAWLQAEMQSPRFAQSYQPLPWETAADTAYIKQIIETPNVGDPAESFIRKTILAVARGFGCGRYIFTGLTNDITWRRVRFTTDEIGQMFYANNVASWRTLSATLRVSEGAERVRDIQPQDDYVQIIALAQKIHDSDLPSLPEIICLSRPDGDISVMEGHSRATAFVMEAAKCAEGVEAYVGAGASVANWIYL
jgi:hypothetical protein